MCVYVVWSVVVMFMVRSALEGSATFKSSVSCSRPIFDQICFYIHARIKPFILLHCLCTRTLLSPL